MPPVNNLAALDAIRQTLENGSSPIDMDVAASFALVAPVIDFGDFNRLCTAIRLGTPIVGTWSPELIAGATYLRGVGMPACIGHTHLRWGPGEPINATLIYWLLAVYSVYMVTFGGADDDDMMMMMMEGIGDDEPEPDPDYAERQRLAHLDTMRRRSEAAARQPVGELARWAAGVA